MQLSNSAFDFLVQKQYRKTISLKRRIEVVYKYRIAMAGRQESVCN